MNFTGVKVALICGDSLVTIVRDNRHDIPYPGDDRFTGWRQENNETPLSVQHVKIKEELGISINPNSVLLTKQYPAMHNSSLAAYFLVLQIS